MRYRFGDCELDGARFELRRAGRLEPLEPQVFALLLYLIENRDRAVTRAELNRAVWGGRIVTDSALNSCIKAARHAIGDDGKSQSRIRTLHRTGYRFVGPVSEQPEAIAPASGRDVAPASSEIGAPDPRHTAPAQVTSPAPAASRSSRSTAGALGLAVLLLLGGFGMWSLRGSFAPVDSAEVVQLAIPDVGPPVRQPFGVRHLAISADGTRVAYTAQARLWIRPMREQQAVVVEATTPMDPFFSPDGEWVGFFELTGLMRVPSTGDTPTQIVATSERPAGASWGTDGNIVFATTSGIYKVAESGGEPQLLAKPEFESGERLYAWPHFVADEQAVLFTVYPQNATHATRIVRLDLRTGEARVLLSGGVAARYAPTGHLVYTAGRTLYAVAVDPAVSVTRGPPVAFPGISIAVGPDNGVADFAFAGNGTLVYIGPQASDEGNRQLSWVDRAGAVESLALRPDRYTNPRISPDGRLVALDIPGVNRDVWILDLRRRNLTRLTTSSSEDMLPLWSVDGRRVYFASDRAGSFDIYSRAVSGPAEERVELAGAGFQVPHSFTPDGRRLIVYENFHDVSVLDIARSRLEPLLRNEFEHRIVELSPDGRWIAYESDESGQQFEIFLRPFPDVSTRREQVSIDGGRYPKWGPPGSGELYYVDLDGGMMAAAVELEPTLRLGGVTKLFDWRPPPRHVSGRPYDLSPLDGRFLMLEAAKSADAVTHISVVLNWFNELRRPGP